ncbi:MAG: MaoC/PaaZ C-terminal domain-containing protein [Methyloligellaceae bacterium]
MAIDVDKLLNWPFETVEQSYTARDTILYALGLGLGADPLDEDQLRFTFEESEGFAALPTMPLVLAGPGFWIRNPESGIDWKKILHGEQAIELHGPLPTAATVTARTRVTDVIDKGADRGALVYSERTLTDKATGAKVATLKSTTFARADGGFGGASGPTKPVHALPEHDPDLHHDTKTLPQAALIYRLSGDPNPLHASPTVAAESGFEAPILHGLCTLGIAGHAILKTCCGTDPARFKSLALRFSAPVYPGETIRTEIWRDGETVSFRARALERDAVVLNNGKAVVAA